MEKSIRRILTEDLAVKPEAIQAAKGFGEEHARTKEENYAEAEREKDRVVRVVKVP